MIVLQLKVKFQVLESSFKLLSEKTHVMSLCDSCMFHTCLWPHKTCLGPNLQNLLDNREVCLMLYSFLHLQNHKILSSYCTKSCIYVFVCVFLSLCLSVRVHLICSWAETLYEARRPVQQLPHGPLQDCFWRDVQTLRTHKSRNEENELCCSGVFP